MAKSGYLTGQEYRAIRNLLGMTLHEAKEFHKVQNISTIKRWENGYSKVSELACDKITELLKKINWGIEQGISQYKSLPEDVQKQTEVVLIVYPDECFKKFVFGFQDLPNSVHKTMIYRLYLCFKELGAEVGIVEFNPQDYFTFMAKNNYKDAPDIRSAWACDYRGRLVDKLQ